VLDFPYRFKYGHLAENGRTLAGYSASEGAPFPTHIYHDPEGALYM
jgi:hypothetical protein